MSSQSLSNPLPEHIHPAHSTFYCARHLERNAELGISLHVLQKNLLPAAIVEFRSSAVGMAGDSLSGFKSAVIFQKIPQKLLNLAFDKCRRALYLIRDCAPR